MKTRLLLIGFASVLAVSLGIGSAQAQPLRANGARMQMRGMHAQVAQPRGYHAPYRPGYTAYGNRNARGYYRPAVRSGIPFSIDLDLGFLDFGYYPSYYPQTYAPAPYPARARFGYYGQPSPYFFGPAFRNAPYPMVRGNHPRGAGVQSSPRGMRPFGGQPQRY